ncbi:MAG: bifunctional histidinol-phosphatase/imidazoleglycerol-phosphate dehydratase HisB [Ignavibacteriae bacterium]|nr:MAG: bifunctional histidinol-phosphatase/imidazoleglycerol-phosphate dehydratase HisB [Ignavibacteriota bacterium]
MNVVFLDRDGTLVAEPPDEQVDSLEKLELIPGVIQGLRLLQDRGYTLVMVSNQDNLGTAAYPQKNYDMVQDKLTRLLNGEGIQFQAVFVCPHGAHEQCPCRKPKTGLVDEFIRADSVNLLRSFVLGDRESDVLLARNIGCKAVRLTSDASTQADFATERFLEACRYIARSARSAAVERTTSETRITIEVFLDGSGISKINTGIGFFDHMLALLSKHSGIDLTIDVQGDLHVDEHHSVEDTGLALGDAIRQALGDKRGIERYGFLLPMDESLAQAALDLGGRPFCKFEAKFEREQVGEFPTELVEDFFRAFADGMRANLHITVSGRNDHHKIEAIFKAVAKSLLQAVRIDEQRSTAIPSTKGRL